MRTLLAFIAVLGVGLGWLVSRANVQRDAVAAIRRAGGRVSYDCDPRGMTRPDPNRIGIDYFHHPVMASFTAREGRAEEILSRVAHLRRIHTLSVRSAVLEDNSLGHLAGMTDLRSLQLHDTRVGDDNLAHIEGLRGLRILRLDDPGVTDAGLARLRGMTKLKQLDLGNT